MAVTHTIEVITGPTASGKTALAFAMAEQDPSIEIISADAFQIYRGFDIGTGKSPKADRERIPHHCIDILDPHESYSAGQYSRSARSVIEEIIARGMTPLVVGGSGLYIDALFFGVASLDVDDAVKQEARARYQRELDASSFEHMHEKLREVDPELFAQIARERNPLRLERAWVHYYATGVPLGIARKADKDQFQYRPNFRLLLPEREALRQQIAERVEAMLATGWEDEVRTLLAAGVRSTMPAMRAIGYADLADVVEGKVGLAEARRRIIDQTRQYAKRQMTWMKRYEKH